ncbi:MAG: hypothetical protein WCP72_11070 [Desulfomonile sp.]
MTNTQADAEPISASIFDTVFFISPNNQLVESIRDFCASKNMKLWIGDPDSPDVIAIPYRIGIVDKAYMGQKSWADWIEFLRDTKGVSHEHLLIIILPPPFSEAVLDEAKKEFEDAHDDVRFTFDTEGRSILKIIGDWLGNRSKEPSLFHDATSTIVPSRSGEKTQATFRDRLEELMNRIPSEDTNGKVNLDVYFKFRIRAKWLLVQGLGESHPYTKELDSVFLHDMDPFAAGSYLLAAKGILEALVEDLDHGLIAVKE